MEMLYKAHENASLIWREALNRRLMQRRVSAMPQEMLVEMLQNSVARRVTPKVMLPIWVMRPMSLAVSLKNWVAF